jgi:hypothetical protein
MCFLNYLFLFSILSLTIFGLNNDNINDEWVVYFDGNLESVKKYAKSNDLLLIGKVRFELILYYNVLFIKYFLVFKVGSLNGYYRFKSVNFRKKRFITEDDYKIFENKLKLTSQVKWVGRQKRLIRTKRDLIDFENSKKVKKIENYNDPLWSKMWYLNRNSIKILVLVVYEC